jgi:hypothetical protein
VKKGSALQNKENVPNNASKKGTLNITSKFAVVGLSLLLY